MPQAENNPVEGFEYKPLTAECWKNFERLFGPRGACAGCWCMWWRLDAAQFNRGKGEGNNLAMRDLVQSGHVPGILGYIDGVPAGWCSVAPRGEFPRLARSRTLKPLDDTPVWSLVCLFVERAQRRKGLSVALIRAALEYASARGARIVEAYPVIPKSGKAADVFIYTGTLSAFERAGFSVAARPSPSRAIVRYRIGGTE